MEEAASNKATDNMSKLKRESRGRLAISFVLDY